MKNITLSAQDELIQRARQVAWRRRRTLNDMFREWLDGLVKEDELNPVGDKLDGLWQKSDYMKVGKKLSREQMNER